MGPELIKQTEQGVTQNVNVDVARCLMVGKGYTEQRSGVGHEVHVVAD